MAAKRGRKPKIVNATAAASASTASQNTLVICNCCGRKMTRASRAQHKMNRAPTFISATSAHRRAMDMTYILTGQVPEESTAPAFINDDEGPIINRHCAPVANNEEPRDMRLDAGCFDGGFDDHDTDMFINDDMPTPLPIANDNGNIEVVMGAALQRPINNDHDSSESDLEDEDELESEDPAYKSWIEAPLLEDDPFSWSLINEDIMDDGRGLTAEEMLGEDFEREAANNENRLTESDLLILRAFYYKHTYFLSQCAFKALPFVFPMLKIPSIDIIRARIHYLSGLNTVAYDCCANSCCCFVGNYKDDLNCHFCNEPRYTSDGKTPRKKYSYTPIIPRLRGMYENKSICKELRYRHEYELPFADTNGQPRSADNTNAMADIWDGTVYKDLRKRHIKINEQVLQQKYFEDSHDIALGLSTDGFAPWRKRKYTAWPLLLFNYNLPPEIRFHQKNIIAVSVIPGPQKPKDIDSFLYPLVEELLNLANGVRAFDASTGELFSLRAFLIVAFGDIPAVSLLMKMKGHNAIVPCRYCNIHGLRVPGSDATAHYVPLDRSSHPDAGNILQYDPKKLPMRTHEQYIANVQSVITTTTVAEEDRLAKEYGIKGRTILLSLDSLSFPLSMPYDFMHLMYENQLKNLILFWTNNFKGLDTGTGEYGLSVTVWNAIGAATAKSSDTIPSAYSARLGDIAGDRSRFTADNYAFWGSYFGPVLLQRKFSRPCYYEHFVQLVRLIHVCLKFEYTISDMKFIRDGFIDWVVTYEQLYYQHSPARLSTCPLTLHALLHIADGIEACGPVWAYWAFPMERYCARLQRAVANSRRHPYVTLDKFIAEDAMLTLLKMRYNLYSELNFTREKNEDYGHRERRYPTCALLPPHSAEPLPSNIIDRISVALATRYKVTKAVAKRHIPPQIDQWGKVRRIDGGDTMVAALIGHMNLDRRDATHVRYQALVDLHARNRRQLSKFSKSTFYGQLLRIFCFTIAASPQLLLLQPETLILAEIQPCKVTGRHASLDIHYFKNYATPLVFDITCIQCLVGRVKPDTTTNSGWAIIDRSGTLAQAIYTEDGAEDEVAQQ